MPQKFFCYSTGWVTLAGVIGTTAEKVLSIAAGSHFVCTYITISVRQAGKLVSDWAGDVMLSDSGTDKDWFNADNPVHAFAGSGQLPYPVNPNRVIPALSSLTVKFTNNVATATEVNLVLHGYKDTGN